jgi:aminobenzoyl-glutamate utilization protein B
VPIAEAMHANIKKVGYPQWSEEDKSFAVALQKELKVPVTGLSEQVGELRRPAGSPSAAGGGGSDDIGDISWNVPTVTLRYPANIQAGPGHNWANAIAMATPIAHKGVVAGAKAQAMTLLDLITKPQLVTAAWDYFKNVQTKDTKYKSFLRPTDEPALFLNKRIMDEFRPRMKEQYYNPGKYNTYLEQLGITYPTVRQ